MHANGAAAYEELVLTRGPGWVEEALADKAYSRGFGLAEGLMLLGLQMVGVTAVCVSRGRRGGRGRRGAWCWVG